MPFTATILHHNLLKLCNKAQPEYGFNGTIGYLYQSVADACKFEGMHHEFIYPVMEIGRLINLSDSDYLKALSSRLRKNKTVKDQMIDAFKKTGLKDVRYNKNKNAEDSK